MKRYSIALIATLCIFSAAQARAQSTFGSIVGVVRDPTQSVVPGTVVTLRSLDDNSERTATVAGDGAFEFVNLKPGRYSLTAQAPGFADFQVSSAQLDARQTLRIDVALALKSGAEVIEVQAEAAAINTENGTIGNTVTNQNLSQLPLNSRAVSTSPLAALALSASVVRDSQGNIAVGGATASQVGFSVDGISTADVRQNGIYQLPFGAGRPWGKPGYMNAVLGGWDLSMVATIQTGQWLTPTISPVYDQSNTDMVVRSGGGAVARPDCVGNPIPADQSNQVFFPIAMPLLRRPQAPDALAVAAWAFYRGQTWST